jgi:hypothetical protein
MVQANATIADRRQLCTPYVHRTLHRTLPLSLTDFNLRVFNESKMLPSDSVVRTTES